MKFKAKAQAKTLTPYQMKKVLSRCELMPSPECKKAVMVLSWSTIRVTEISQLTIDDLMFPNGKIKQ